MRPAGTRARLRSMPSTWSWSYIDIGFSPGETLDFLLGFFGIDLAQDDW